MKKKRNIIIGALAVILIAVVVIVLTSSKSADTVYRTVKLERGDISVVVTATGTLNADTTVQVGTQVSGTIARLFADFNSVVKKGQIIAVIDTTFLHTQVQDAVANLEGATARLHQTQRDFSRTEDLFKKGLASQSDYDAAKTNYESAAAALKSAQAALDRARINLKYATIRAPIDGVVISRNVDIGQTVAASLAAPTLFVIANDLTKMQVQASIDEADIGKIHVGQSVKFTVDAYPDRQFQGKVEQVRLQPNVVQNVVNYTVIIEAPNPDLKLMPGMTATITVLVDRRENVLKLKKNLMHCVRQELLIQLVGGVCQKVLLRRIPHAERRCERVSSPSKARGEGRRELVGLDLAGDVAASVEIGLLCGYSMRTRN